MHFILTDYLGIGIDEYLVFASDSETNWLFDIKGMQPLATDMIEGEGDGAVLDLHGCITRALCIYLEAIIVGECEPNQAIGDSGFVAWMYIASFAGINDHSLPGIG